MDPDFQAEFLQKVIDEEVSLKELKTEASIFRALEAIKRAFIRCTNSQSWGDATERFPAFTQEGRLKQFIQLNFHHNIPDVFQTYCQSAVYSGIPTGGTVHRVNSVRVALVKGTLTSTSAQEIKEVDPAYTGAQSILASVPKVSTHKHACASV